MDFDWKRKERLQEQLKFFGASKTRFISCYAKKPKIRILTKIASSNCSVCPDCKGSGVWVKLKCVGDCLKCKGTGKISDASSIECTDSNRGYLISQAQGALGSNAYMMRGAADIANLASSTSQRHALGSLLANQQLALDQAQTRQRYAIEQAHLLNSMRIAKQQASLLGTTL